MKTVNFSKVITKNNPNSPWYGDFISDVTRDVDINTYYTENEDLEHAINTAISGRDLISANISLTETTETMTFSTPLDTMKQWISLEQNDTILQRSLNSQLNYYTDNGYSIVWELTVTEDGVTTTVDTKTDFTQPDWSLILNMS